ncbi:MAG: PH domain-containing protein [Omnitrophica WOR_2 bacterium]
MAKGYIERMMGEHEKILYITRQHWFVFFNSILVEIFIAIILILLTVAVTAFLHLVDYWIPVIVGFILLLVPILGGLRDFLFWWNREYLITNRRVIQISGVVNKDVIDSSLEKVNDVKLDQSFFGRLLNFGDVEILTASELGANLFRRISDPIHFKTVMLNAKEELERGAGSVAPRAEHTGDIPSLIAELDELRRQGVLTEAEFQAKKNHLLGKI